jgi:hypothetical protein
VVRRLEPEIDFSPILNGISGIPPKQGMYFTCSAQKFVFAVLDVLREASAVKLTSFQQIRVS